MKKVAKLSIMFSLCFAIIFIIACGIHFLGLWVDWAKSLPPRNETFLTLLITSAHWALSLAMYSSILLSIGYAARRNCFAPVTLICIMALSLCFNYGISTLLDHWKYVPPAETKGIQMGDTGLILSNSIHRNETAVVLLKGTSDPLGPRVVAVPGRAMVYQETAPSPQTATSGAISLPPIPFGDDTPLFMRSLSIDLRLSDEQIQSRFNAFLPSYFLYTGSLIFVLCALAYLIKFSVWPLANLFLGALAFRGVLAVETFFNTVEMQDIFGSFFKNILPVSSAVPIIFIVFGALILVFSFLVFVTKRRDKDEY
jgi:hypothetical protein